MIFEFAAAVAMGFAAAGIVLAINWTTGGLLPRFATPAAAGLAMIAFGAWSEYSWFDRQRASLPEGMAVVLAKADASPLRPWTYLSPYVTRFAVVDQAGAQTNAEQPGLLLTSVYLFARYTPTRRVPVLIDCSGGRRADLLDNAGFAQSGAVREEDWRDLARDDPLLEALCPAG